MMFPRFSGSARFVAGLILAAALSCDMMVTASTSSSTVTPSSTSSTDDYFFCLGNSDGACDADNNNNICGYDGGDCCECTCVGEIVTSTLTITCGGFTDGGEGYACTCEGNAEYACLSSSCVNGNDTTLAFGHNPGENITVTSGGCVAESFCDNEEECGVCTCAKNEMVITSLSGLCGENGYDCIDPRASCVDESSEAPSLATSVASSLGTFVAVFGAMQLANLGLGA